LHSAMRTNISFSSSRSVRCVAALPGAFMQTRRQRQGM
jgi:hypothetical protein